MMDGPNLDDLKNRCNNLIFKHRKSVEASWDGISLVALQYWEHIFKPWEEATPKVVEKEYEDVAIAATAMIGAMRRMSGKARSLAFDFAMKNPMVQPKNLLSFLLSDPGKDSIEKTPVLYSWLKCEGQAWFLDQIPRETRASQREGMSRDKWDNMVEWGRLRELGHVVRIAEHFQAQARAIKEERTRKGYGGTWGDSIWEEDPERMLCRSVQHFLLEQKQPKTYAGPIAREIYIWAHPKLPEEEWPSPEYFGVRRLK